MLISMCVCVCVWYNPLDSLYKQSKKKNGNVLCVRPATLERANDKTGHLSSMHNDIVDDNVRAYLIRRKQKDNVAF